MGRGRSADGDQYAGVAMSRTPIAVAAMLVALVGCDPGDEPSLGEPVTEVDDAAADVVYDLLSDAGDTAFTATYAVTPSLTGETTVVTVRHDPATTTEVETRGIVFVGAGEEGSTCADAVCRDGADDAVISDLSITHRFWAPAFAIRLRLDTGRRIGFTEATTTEIAGRPAECVAIPQAGTVEIDAVVTYCALDAGPLARYAGADVAIEMTSFVPGAPEFVQPVTDASE